MLQQMRAIPKWISQGLFVILALSFGVWGIADVFRGNVDTSVATVGDEKVPLEFLQRDFNNDKNRELRSGTMLTPAQTRDIGNHALQHLIDGIAVDQVTAKMGLVASDDQIRQTIQEIPAFKGPLGTFDKNTFEEVLGRMGFSEAGFVAELRNDITRNELSSATSNGIMVPQGLATALFNYFNEHRAVQYVVLPDDAAGAIPPPDDATLTAYIKSHPAEFSTPEYRDVTFATIAPEDLMSGLTVSDDQLHQQYELNKDKYIIPERRDIEQITFPDQASAALAYTQINSGKSFADVAAARGLKPIVLSGEAQADLGPDRGAAAFAVPSGGVTKPVKFIVGWVIMHVTKVAPGSSKSFDDVKASLKQDALKLLAGNKLADVGNAFTDDRGGGDTLEEAAKKNDMHVVHIAAVDGNGLAPDGTKAGQLPAEPEFLPQVFKSEVGEDEDPFAASDGRQFVVRVNGVTPPKLKPLALVRAQVTAEWTANERLKRLAAKAKELAAQASASHSLAAVSASLHATALPSPALNRGEATATFQAPVIDSIFSARPATAVYGPTSDGKSYIVALVTGVIHPPVSVGNPAFQQFNSQLVQFMRGDISGNLAKAARTKETVKINQQQVDQMIGSGS